MRCVRIAVKGWRRLLQIGDHTLPIITLIELRNAGSSSVHCGSAGRAAEPLLVVVLLLMLLLPLTARCVLPRSAPHRRHSVGE